MDELAHLAVGRSEPGALLAIGKHLIAASFKAMKLAVGGAEAGLGGEHGEVSRSRLFDEARQPQRSAVRLG